jgi:hypothetical protein
MVAVLPVFRTATFGSGHWGKAKFDRLENVRLRRSANSTRQAGSAQTETHGFGHRK